MHFVFKDDAAPENYAQVFADAVVLSAGGQLVLQRRPESWGRYGGRINIFGGHAEAGETPLAAVCRELQEELGAAIRPEEMIFLGVIEEHEETETNAVYVHFWHDRDNRITGCYEAEEVRFDRLQDVIDDARLMPYAALALQRAKDKGLIP